MKWLRLIWSPDRGAEAMGFSEFEKTSLSDLYILKDKSYFPYLM